MKKTCRDCGIEKDVKEFDVRTPSKDGYRNNCKECRRKKVADYAKTDNGKMARQEANKKYFSTEKGKKTKQRYAETDKRKAVVKRFTASEKNIKAQKIRKERQQKLHPNRYAANVILNNAVRDEKLEKLPCFICGAKKVEGHHPDYDRPLDVVWLCPKHHRKLHLDLENASK